MRARVTIEQVKGGSSLNSGVALTINTTSSFLSLHFTVLKEAPICLLMH